MNVKAKTSSTIQEPWMGKAKSFIPYSETRKLRKRILQDPYIVKQLTESKHKIEDLSVINLDGDDPGRWTYLFKSRRNKMKIYVDGKGNIIPGLDALSKIASETKVVVLKPNFCGLNL